MHRNGTEPKFNLFDLTEENLYRRWQNINSKAQKETENLSNLINHFHFFFFARPIDEWTICVPFNERENSHFVSSRCGWKKIFEMINVLHNKRKRKTSHRMLTKFKYDNSRLETHFKMFTYNGKYIYNNFLQDARRRKIVHQKAFSILGIVKSVVLWLAEKKNIIFILCFV